MAPSVAPSVSLALRLYVLGACVLGLVLLVSLAHAGHLAPGCDNQSLRPRLVGCCPRYLSGETLPPQCLRWEASGHLAQCCGDAPTPAPSPEATCPGPSWYACWPTPQPTPTYAIVTDKSSCCAHVRALYSEARYAIVNEKRAALKDLLAWKQQAMRMCREEYQR